MKRFTKNVALVFLGCFAVLSQAAEDQSGTELLGADAFGCIRDMAAVGDFYVANFKGDLQATVKIAESDAGGTYPAGSIVQLVPGEVMVKYDKGFSPATKDWEFIELDVSAEATTIRKRGFVDVVNRFGGNCFACHIKAKPEFDLVCKQGRGCDPIALTADMIKGIQNTDPRCKPIPLPAEQVTALQQLKAALEKPAAEE